MADNQSSCVNIMVTAPSDNEAERQSSSASSDEEDDDYIYSDDGDHTLTDGSEDDTSPTEVAEAKHRAEESEDKLCEDFANGATVSDEKPASSDEKIGAKSGYEIVGDRVLVEKDGKFELVDANEIKAEYFDMLGIKPEAEKNNGDVSPKAQDKPTPQARPKTTPARSTRGVGEQGRVATKRAQSSWGHRTRGNNEYSHIRSPYGLTEKQLEIKRRREEAIAKRKKEEEEMRLEEEKRRREDAEKAFQAWLNSKKEEEKERRKSASKDDADDGDERAAETARAVKAWKMSKKKQEQQEQEEAHRRMEETASMYVVHDREACEEAFKRWRRRKRAEQKAKELEKKKKQRAKSRRKPKEALPINSPKIRFTDNYGYRNAVVY